VFQKMTRGAMMEAGLYELERMRKANPGMSEDEIASKTAKQLNVFFGNLGKQGWVKSATFQDLSRIALLAPQWVESMAQTELRSYGQAAKALIDPRLLHINKIGVLARSMGIGAVSFIVANQVVNMLTRGKPTWDNEEKGHKWDAYIPMGDEGKGLWLSPFMPVAELSHDFINYMSNGKGVFGSASQIFKNKLQPTMRAVWTAVNGVNYRNQQLLSDKEVAKEVGKSLLPTPIPASGLMTGEPLQLARSAFSSLGMKMEATSFKEAREHRFEKEFNKQEGQGTIGERRKFENEEQERKEVLSPVDRLWVEQKAAANRERDLRAIESGVSKPHQQWLKEQKLSLSGYEEKEFKVRMTDDEAKRYQQLVIKHYDDALDKAKDIISNRPSRELKQKTLDAVLARARKMALRDLNTKPSP
jgi:hypothetical protein